MLTLLAYGLIRVECRIGYAHFGNGNRYADEVVAIEIEKLIIHARFTP